jgi:5-formyltetrahydrofolate cyclo-ligase
MKKIKSNFSELQKIKIRHKFLTLRNKIKSVFATDLSAKIFALVKTLRTYQKAKTLMFYLSCGSEVVTDIMVESAIKEGKIIVVPAVSNFKNMQMQAVKIEKLKDAYQLAYGVRQPEVNSYNIVKKKDIDLIFVPGIVFDIFGYRIGYGKGYYDRWLKSVPITKTVGLAYDFQITGKKLPISKYDLPVCMVITEKKIIQAIKN